MENQLQEVILDEVTSVLILTVATMAAAALAAPAAVAKAIAVLGAVAVVVVEEAVVAGGSESRTWRLSERARGRLIGRPQLRSTPTCVESDVLPKIILIATHTKHLARHRHQ